MKNIIKTIKEDWSDLIVPAIVVSALLASAYAFLFIDTDVDCDDFSSQEAAQEFFLDIQSEVGGDLYNLDKDDDGIACEGLE